MFPEEMDETRNRAPQPRRAGGLVGETILRAAAGVASLLIMAAVVMAAAPHGAQAVVWSVVGLVVLGMIVRRFWR